MSPISHAGAQRAQEYLRKFAHDVEGIESAVVASVDGFALASVAQRNHNGDRLAAMTSSMLALANAIGRELVLGELEVLMIDASYGKVMMLSIPKMQPPLLLMAACSRSSIMGSILWRAKECGQKIRAALEEDQASASENQQQFLTTQ